MLHRIRVALWIGLTPDLELTTLDLDDADCVPVARSAMMPTWACGQAYISDPLGAIALREFKSEAAQRCVLFWGADEVGTESSATPSTPGSETSSPPVWSRTSPRRWCSGRGCHFSRWLSASRSPTGPTTSSSGRSMVIGSDRRVLPVLRCGLAPGARAYFCL